MGSTLVCSSQERALGESICSAKESPGALENGGYRVLAEQLRAATNNGKVVSQVAVHVFPTKALEECATNDAGREFRACARTAYPLRMKVRYVYWQEDDHWLGYFEEFPDYWTQGESLEDLKEHLRDLHDDLSNDRIPEVRRTAELEVN